jgi:alanyl-tRNA synthetase
MLGNFSFGDYFKKDAIAYAWELVTAPQPHGYGIPKDRLYTTIFKGEEGIPRDKEAHDEWLATGVPANRICEFGLEDNFWAMGDTGPCGPCSEIHYDMGPAASELGHKDCQFGCDCGRYLEIWNLVFMQFNRDASGQLTPLPKPCVDTGMGLERICAAVLNLRDPNRFSNYDTDLFQALIRHAGELTGTKYGSGTRADASLRIIADHSRATAFLIADGVLPSNEGRGYVLRKIMRRALRHGHLLKPDAATLTEMIPVVKETMAAAYPELAEIGQILRVAREEQERFHRVLESSLEKLEEDLRPLAALAGKPGEKEAVYPGDKAFRLYDTFGLPRDFIEDACRDLRVRFDGPGFERAMEEQRTRAKASWKGAAKEVASPVYTRLAAVFRTEPDFYFESAARDCHIEAIVTKSGEVNEVKPDEDAEVVLDRTAIYAEAGGQVADVGRLYDSSESQELAEVRGAYYPVGGLIAHKIVAKETLAVGDRVAAVADAERRAHIKRNHTATHLMHAALRNTLGTHVKQAGSLVAPDRLRFDFSHFRNVDPAELRDIEQQVNEQILHDLEITTDILPLEEALNSGALAFFGDRYPESNVRVVTIADPHSPRGFYSKELCGGTHVQHTGEIGVFKFVAEQSVASGVRRVEAITGAAALERFQAAATALRGLAEMLNVSEEQVPARLAELSAQVAALEKKLRQEQSRAALSKVEGLAREARNVRDVLVLSARVPVADRESLRQLVDALRQKLGSGVVVLGATDDGKVALISGVTKDLTARLHAGKIIQAVAKQVGGSGGGRPDLAEAGGKDTQGLDRAISGVYELIEQMLSSA